MQTSTDKVERKVIVKMGLKSSLIFLPLMGFLFFDLLLICVAKKVQVHHYKFVLQEKNVTRMCNNKTILTVNGKYPGPEIRVHKGDRVFVNVHNNGKYGVTIHWHGVKQPRNPWSDGPENVTQCPIPPQTNFTQEIIFSDEEGTLWWHAHSDWTRSTIYGSIVVLPPPGVKYPFKKPDGEETILLGEWYNDDEHEAVENYLANNCSGLLDSDGYTINGQLGDTYNCSTEQMYRMNVCSGKTYLLRIINAILNEQMFFGIANHSLTVVGMDGAYIKPMTRDFVMISPGQTMNVLVTANQAPDNYYMAGSPYADTIAPENKDNITTAMFHYDGNYTPSESPYMPDLPAYNDSDAAMNFTMSLKNRYLASVPRRITRRIFMTVSVNQLYCPSETSTRTASASLTNISFSTPTIDILQAYYWNLSNIYNSTFPNKPNPTFNYTGNFTAADVLTKQETAVVTLNYGDAVEIIFQGTNMGAAESHPMHLHGYSFYVVGMGLGNFNKSYTKNYNLRNPPYINTIALPKNGWTTIRFLADNPGVWFMHCHLERHAFQGMATVFIVKDGHNKNETMLPPPTYMPPCSA